MSVSALYPFADDGIHPDSSDEGVCFPSSKCLIGGLCLFSAVGQRLGNRGDVTHLHPGFANPSIHLGVSLDRHIVLH